MFMYGYDICILYSYKGKIVLKTFGERDTHIYVIGHYNPSVRIIDLVSHTTYVNFMHKWRDLQFKVDCERQIFCQNSAEKKSPMKYFFVFNFDV